MNRIRHHRSLMAMGMLSYAFLRAQTGEVVVTATRGWADPSRVAGSVTVIEGSEVTGSGRAILPEVLQDVPGLWVRSQGGPLAEVSLRGAGENAMGRVLVLLDGRRINNPDMATLNWLQVPMNAVERIEVFRGPQSALYGDFAESGVIHIRTRPGAEDPRSEAALIVGSDGTAIVRGGASGRLPNRPVYGSAQGEWQTTEGWRERSAYRGGGAGGRFGWAPTPDTDVQINASFYANDYELPGWLSRSEMKDHPRMSRFPDDEARSWNGAMGADYRYEWPEGSRLDLSAGWTHRRTESDMTSWAAFTDTETDLLSVQPRLWLAWTPMGSIVQRTLLGWDGYGDRLTVDRFADAARGTKGMSAELRRTTTGGYVRHEIETDPSWIWHGGLRVERSRIEADGSAAGQTVLEDDKAHDGWAWEVGTLWAFLPGGKLYWRANRVYRYPMLDEQVSYYGYGSDALYGDLEAEHGIATEAGLEGRLGRAGRAGVTAFVLRMKDEVAWDPVAWRNANLDATKREGIETWAEWHWTRFFTARGGYTFTDATFTDGPNEGHEVPLVPRHVAQAALTAQLPFHLEARFRVRYVAKAWLGGDYANTGDTMDAYTVGDLMVRFKPEDRPWGAFVAVDNLWDERYATLAYRGFPEDGYYPASGRQWRAGLNMSF